MSKRRRRMAALLCSICLFTALPGCGSGVAQDKPRVAVIVKSVDSNFFQNMRNGVNTAATEYQVSVTFEGPQSEEDYVTQNDMIARAVDNGVDAIVLSAIDFERSVAAVEDAVRRGVKVVTVDSGVRSGMVSQFIGTDNRQAGKQAAAAAVERSDAAEPLHIGTVNYTEATDNGKQREEGFREYLRQIDHAAITASVTVDSTVEAAAEGALRLLRENPDLNVLVGFNEWLTLGIGEAIRQTGSGDRVRGIGFDSNITSVSMLETGEMDALIVQNPFAMGYLGVKNAAALIAGEKPDESEVYTAVVTVEKDNMFDSDVQKILFRFD